MGQVFLEQKMENKTEQELISIAHGPDTDQANLAMKTLRDKFNSTYHFCMDWDQAAMTSDECECYA